MLPQHIAITMDGNGRWAEQRGLPRLRGHQAGVDNIRRVVEEVCKYEKVRFLTLFAFSTENWRRPQEEVQGLMQLLQEVIDRETQALHQQGVRLRHLGRLDRVSPSLREAILNAMALTRHNQRLTLSVAFDYGGRHEILEAVKALLKNGTSPEGLDEDTFSRYLYTADLPDPDLVIRTAGEMRLSNFLLWQSAYSEFYYTPTLWPDFGREEIEKALEAYSRRCRRFGGLNPR